MHSVSPYCYSVTLTQNWYSYNKLALYYLRLNTHTHTHIHITHCVERCEVRKKSQPRLDLRVATTFLAH